MVLVGAVIVPPFHDRQYPRLVPHKRAKPRPYGGCMYLENIVMDAADPQRLGRFWEAALGSERLTDEPEGFETRIAIEGGPVLDLCLQRVPEPATERPRLHLDLLGGPGQAEVVERLLGLGARPLDIGQGDVPWIVLADLEGNA